MSCEVVKFSEAEHALKVVIGKLKVLKVVTLQLTKDTFFVQLKLN